MGLSPSKRTTTTPPTIMIGIIHHERLLPALPISSQALSVSAVAVAERPE